jgi:hypothetical protein
MASVRNQCDTRIKVKVDTCALHYVIDSSSVKEVSAEVVLRPMHVH